MMKLKVTDLSMLVVCAFIVSQAFMHILKAQQPLSNKGRSFYVGFMPNRDMNPDNRPELKLFIHARQATKGRAMLQNGKWETSFEVKTGAFAVIELPISTVLVTKNELATHQGIFIEAEDSIQVIAINSLKQSSEVTTVLPIEVLGEEYNLLTYVEPNFPCQALILAQYDGTQIEVTPSVSTLGGKSAHQKFYIHLNKGQTYLIQSNEDLTGSTFKEVSNDCKPFALFAGAQWTNAGNCGRGNHLFEQAIPVQYWGNNFVILPYLDRQGDLVRILASKNNTVININNQTVNLNAGQYHTFLNNSISYIQSNQPILIAQISRGSLCDQVHYSDPTLVYLVPLNTIQPKEAQWVHLPIDFFEYGYINCVVDQEAVSSVRWNGKAIGNLFRPVPQSGGKWYYYQTKTDLGLNFIQANKGQISVLAYGFGGIDGYAYQANPIYRTLPNIVAPNSICSGTEFRVSVENLAPENFIEWQLPNNVRCNRLVCSQYIQQIGTYTLKLIYQNGNCKPETLFHTFRVIQPDIYLLNEKHVSCFGNQDGRIQVAGANGVPPYVFQIHSGGVNQTGIFDGLDAREYSIQVIDALSCSSNPIQITIKEPPVLNLTLKSKSNLSCYSTQDGRIELNAEGGKPPYRFSINNQPYSSNPTFSNLPSGVYQAMVIDVNGCVTKIQNITLEKPEVIVLKNINLIPHGCKSLGSIKANIQGGVPPYSVSIDDTLRLQTSGYFEFNLKQGSYIIRITDSNKCTLSYPTTINQAPKLDLIQILLKEVSCYNASDGRIIVLLRGGTPPYYYSSNGKNNNDTGQWDSLPAGIYKIRMIDALNCSIDTTIILNNPPLLLFDSLQITPTSCNNAQDGAIKIFASGGKKPYKYSLNHQAFANSANFTNLSKGRYKIIVTDAQNCKQEYDTIVSSSIYSLKLNVDSLIPPSCPDRADGSLFLSATGGLKPYDFSLFNSIYEDSRVFTHLRSGEYYAIVRDALGCTDSMLVLLYSPNNITIKNTEIVNPKCFQSKDGAIIVNADGKNKPLLFMLNDSIYSESGSWNKLKAGRYLIRIKDNQKCELKHHIDLSEPAPIKLNYEKTDLLCYDTSTAFVILNANGGVTPYLYRYDSEYNSNNIFKSLKSGNHLFFVKDSNECQASIIVNIQTPDPLKAEIKNERRPSCQFNTDGMLEIKIEGGTPSYRLWLNDSLLGSPVIENLSQGFYKLTILDSNNCKLILYKNLNAQLNIDAGKDLQFCLNRLPLQIIHNCEGVPKGGFWSGNGISHDGKINLIINQDSIERWIYYQYGNCKDSLKLKASYVQVDKEAFICPMDTLFIPKPALPKGGYWAGSFVIDNYTGISKIIPEAYSFKIIYQTPYGCKDTLTVRRTKSNNIIIDSEPKLPTSLRLPETQIKLYSMNNIGKMLRWDMGDGSKYYDSVIFHKYQNIGVYRIKVKNIDQFGCVDSIFTTVEILPPKEFALPNAFSPNQDGVNDYWTVLTEDYTEYELYIYDRWGNLVFYQNNGPIQWDGSINNQISPESVFVCKFSAYHKLGYSLNYIGTITLIK